MRFNENQLAAINSEGSNILVSAGAGSGKTAVLTERILRKLKEGVSIDSLIIITFTKAAAAEMKERIKHKIETEIQNGNTDLIPQLDKLETANISTFDAFSLNLLKTYHYKLNLSKNVQIGEGLIFTIETDKIIDEYFNQNLESNLLKYFAVGGKKSLYENLRNSYMKYSINIDYEFEESDYLNEYYSLLKNELYKIEETLEEIASCEIEEYIERYIEIKDLFTLDGEEFYEQLINIKNNKVTLSRKQSAKEYNNIIKTLRKQVEVLFDSIIHLSYEENILQNDFLDTQKFKDEIKFIFNYIDEKLMSFKLENSIFDFIDVSKLVIKLLKENEDIRLTLKNNINEVLIDEYQDTVLFQDQLVSLITENNIFMVGDVKQAIYGFRNATPASFNNALNDEKCQKIFLNYNYRSCEKVISNINNIFSDIMDLNSGGVDYDDTQKLLYGNRSFDDIDHSGIDFIKYELNGNKHEVEAQLIANDILKKQKEKNLKFSDFAILCRSKSQFDIYAKVLNANGINVNVFSDVKYISSFEIILIKNLFELAINPSNKLAKASVLRSFLYNYSDQEVASLLDQDIDVLPSYPVNNYQLYNHLLNEFNVLEKTKYLKDPSDAFMRLRYTFDLMKNFDALNYSYKDVIDFFNDIKILERDITFSYEKSTNINAVTMMTIHKSKGLEFPIVYMPALDKLFSIDDIKDHIIFTPEFGLIVHNHYLQQDIVYARHTYDNKVFKQKYLDEMIAEEMRLLYVAMTRAKQDFVFVCNTSFEEEVDKTPRSYMRWLKNYMTIGETFSDIEVLKTINPKHTNSNHSSVNFITNEMNKLNVVPIKRASQLEVTAVDEYQNKLIEEGNKLHLELEYIDFKNLDKYDTSLANNLKEHELFKNIQNYYTEFEYYYNNIHGIIDLLIENENEVIIVDYKLKNINKPEYITQLSNYEEYIKTVTDKKISKYLYSIKDNKLLQI